MIESEQEPTFNIDEIDRAIASGFIDVPIINDFQVFKAWFESLPS